MSVYYPFHPLAGQTLELTSASRRLDLPVTARGPDGLDLKVPRWMLEPSAASLAITGVAALPLGVLRAVSELVAARVPLNTPSGVRRRRPRRQRTRMDQQRRFEWTEPSARCAPIVVALDRETIEVVLALMARALIVVVRDAQERDDER